MSLARIRFPHHAGLLAAVAAAVLLAVPVAGAAPPSPALLERAAHDSSLAARISAFARHSRASGIDAPRGRPVMKPDAKGVLQLRVLQAAPVSGTLRTLALLVDFSDKPHAVAGTAFDSLLFADVFGPTSVRGYYREVSYGSPTSRGLIDMVTVNLPSSTGWLRLPHTMAYYVSGGSNGTGTYPYNAQKMVEDAVAAADPLVDFSQYDNNGDGYVDNLIVIHAGRGAEFTGAAGDIWSHQWSTASPVAVDGVSVSDYSTEPEYWATPGDMTSGVFAHEIGHVLGLPDLYDRDGSSNGIGDWSLMAGGSWNGVNGSSPARLDAWSAAQLGWLQPQLVTDAPATRSIPAVASSRTGSVFKLYPGGATSGSEYFLVENRQKTGTDAALPGAGLLIWHVDETRNDYLYQNDFETHKLVDLEEAAGLQSLDECVDSGSADDPYPGTGAKRAFSDTTDPNAKTYAGIDSTVVVDQIGASAATMSARLGVGSGSTPTPTSSPTPGDGDTTTPVTTAAGYDTLWHSKPVRITFVGIDPGPGASGVAYTEYRIGGGLWTRGLQATVGAPPSGGGTRTVSYRSVDNLGNQEDVRRLAVKLDVVGPVCRARSASVRRGGVAVVKFAVVDNVSPSVRFSVQIRTGTGAIKMAMTSTRWQNANHWRTRSFRCSLKRGAYRIRVIARDLAGNRQSVVGGATLTVR